MHLQVQMLFANPIDENIRNLIVGDDADGREYDKGDGDGDGGDGRQLPRSSF